MKDWQMASFNWCSLWNVRTSRAVRVNELVEWASGCVNVGKGLEWRSGRLMFDVGDVWDVCCLWLAVRPWLRGCWLVGCSCFAPCTLHGCDDVTCFFKSVLWSCFGANQEFLNFQIKSNTIRLYTNAAFLLETRPFFFFIEGILRSYWGPNEGI
jgi:hypothetical protein